MNSHPIRGKLTPSLLKDLVIATLGLLTAFEVFDLTEVQSGAILLFTGVIGLVLTAYGILGSESVSTPVASPVVPAGTTITVQQPGDTPNTTTTV